MIIVCGTDFSRQGGEAVTAAAAIARQLNAPLHLVHVFEAERERWGPAEEEKVRETLASRLADEGKRVAPGVKAGVTTKLLQGWADKELVGYAEKLQPVLAVVASAGHRAEPMALIGGTSERLALSPRVPLLVIRDAAPFTAWVEGKRALKVMVGMDDGSACEGALNLVRRLRQHGPVDAVVGQVYYADEARKRYGLRGPTLSYDEKDPELEELLRRDLRTRVGDPGGKGEVTFRVLRGVGRIADHLLELTESEGADLLVCGTTGRRGVSRAWSTSQAALHAGHVAVLAVPPLAEAGALEARIPSYQRVMVPVDFSALSVAAVPFAYGMVTARQGEVVLTHVIQAQGLNADVAALYEPVVGRVDPSGLRAAIIGKLRALVPAEAVRRGHLTRTEVLEALDVPRAVGELAERLGVDALCMASHGRSGLGRALVGSVTDEVMRATRRPVLVVRPQV